jgi:hypothetical protein
VSYTTKMQDSHRRRGAGRMNYEMIAHVLRGAEPPRVKEIAHREWYAVVQAFVREFASHPGFDRARFERACGVGEGA